MYKVEILVTLKNDVLDPQGRAIFGAAVQLNVNNLVEVKQGKYFEVIVKNVKSSKDASTVAKNLSEKLLFNEVIENYKIFSIKKI